MRISSLLIIFSLASGFQTPVYCQTTIVDIWSSLNLEAPAFSVERVFAQIQDFLTDPRLTKPIALEFLTINEFVPGIARLIDASNFRPDLMILIYGFIDVFPKDAQGRNVLLDLVVEKVRLFLGQGANQEFDSAIQDCLIHRSLSSFSSIFEHICSFDYSTLDPLTFGKLENVLKFLSDVVCNFYQHFNKPGDHDKTQPVLFCCDIFKTLEIKGSFLNGRLFPSIKEFFKTKALEFRIDMVREYLETGTHEKSSFGTCQSCGKEIFFGLSIKIIADELHHQACWFEQKRRELFIFT